MSAGRTLVLLVGFLAAVAVHATDLRAITPNNEGVAQLMKENPYKAYQKFVEAAQEDSFDPTVRMNLGLAYATNKEYPKAVSEFKMAENLSGEDKDMKFKARFNQGVAWAQGENIPEALKAYQAALELKPDSIETKTNIELLWKGDQGKGKGKGDQKDKQKGEGEGGEGDQDQKKDDQNQGQGDPKDKNEKGKPQPFESKELTQDTVRQILDELKAQEQRVRAEHYSKGAKEQPRGKDW